MTRTTDITSFTELRNNLRGELDRIHLSGRPLFVTSKGHPEAVLLSPDAFDRLADKADLVDSLAGIERGLADVAAGRVRPMREGLSQIAEELGLNLDR